MEDVTAGIIFLGCPHTTSIEDEKWENWRWILRSTRKDIPKVSQSEDDIRSLAELCSNFGTLNLNAEVLSVFEAKESRIQRGLWYAFRPSRARRIFVDESLCRTGQKYEQVFPVNADHGNVWLVPLGSEFYKRLVEFFTKVTETAPDDVSWVVNNAQFDDSLSVESSSGVLVCQEDTYGQHPGVPTD